MSTRSQTHEIDIPAPPEAVFKRLMAPTAIRGGWSGLRAIVMELDGMWVLAWGERESDPEYVLGATIKAFEAPRRLVLAHQYCRTKSGALPFAAGMTAEFIIQKLQTGSLLRVTHSGIPQGRETDAFFESAKNGWKATLQGIRQALTPPPR